MSEYKYGLICTECGSSEVYYENPTTGSGKYTCQDCEFMGDETGFNYSIPVKEYDKLTTANESLQKDLSETAERAETYFRQNQEQAATIAQMRDALAQPIETAKKSWSANCRNGCDVSSCGRCFGCSPQALGYLIHSIEQVLSTPPTAYEQRVQGMVEALEFYATFTTDIDNDMGEKAKQALAAFRRGENS